jgi:exonuclease VII large subunit
MPVNYICKRCNYTSKRLGDLKKHLNKKIICTKNPKSYGYTDEELIILSLIPYNNEIQENNNINICNKDVIIINKDELFDIITNIELNKKKVCDYCSKKFNTINNLKNHVLTNCRLKLSLNSQNVNNCETSENTNNDNKIINNIQNNIDNVTNNLTNNLTHNITTNNNITINLQMKPIISFDKDWDISHLDEAVKQSIFLSSYKFTKFIEHILKNDRNLNILFDNENNKGTVYVNDEFKVMDKSNIVDESISKIHSQLTQIYNEIKDNNTFLIPGKYLENEKKHTDDKLDDYKNNDNVRKNVIGCVVNIFEQHKDDIIQKYKELDIYDSTIGF